MRCSCIACQKCSVLILGCFSIILGDSMSDLESEIQRRGLIKVSREGDQKESPYRRVAKFLYLIGEAQAAKVLQKLTREQIEKGVAEMLTIRYVDKDEAAYILSEFTALYNEAKNSVGGFRRGKSAGDYRPGNTACCRTAVRFFGWYRRRKTQAALSGRNACNTGACAFSTGTENSGRLYYRLKRCGKERHRAPPRAA